MPELPEVETVVREIRPVVEGAKFWKVAPAGDPKKNPLGAKLKVVSGLLKGKTILSVYRRGKFIVLELSDNLMMVVHLRMTGMLLFEPSERLKKFLRLEFTFTNGQKMYFSDIRRFGKIVVASKKDYLQHSGMAKLGPDPISDGVDLKYLKSAFWGRKGILKSRLLDQRALAGIGNIYADEICFRSCLHPQSRTEKLTVSDLRRLRQAIKACLLEGIEHNGTTISDFVGTRGDAGKHQKYLRIYGRKGGKCYECKGKIIKTRLSGRGTWICPVCQTLRK